MLRSEAKIGLDVEWRGKKFKIKQIDAPLFLSTTTVCSVENDIESHWLHYEDLKIINKIISNPTIAKALKTLERIENDRNTRQR